MKKKEILFKEICSDRVFRIWIMGFFELKPESKKLK